MKLLSKPEIGTFSPGSVVMQGYLKAAHIVTGTIETSCPCGFWCLSQAWAIAGGGRGLGGLTGECAGGRKVVQAWP